MPGKLPELPDRYRTNTHHNWVAIRTEYIEGIEDEDGTVVYPTLTSLADKHGISRQVVTNRAAKEKWSDHQTAHKNQIAIERQKRQAKMLARKAVKFDEQAADDAMAAQTAIGQRIKQLAQLTELDTYRIDGIMQRIENGETVSESLRKELRSLVSPSEWESIWKAYALANDVGRKALGIKDDEPAINRTTIEINNVQAVSDQLKQADRNRALIQVLRNRNLVIPGVTDQLAIEGNNDDTGSGSESIVPAESGGPIYEVDAAPGPADSDEPYES